MKQLRLRHVISGVLQSSIIVGVVFFFIPGDSGIAQQRNLSWAWPVLWLAAITGFAWCNMQTEKWHSGRRNGN